MLKSLFGSHLPTILRPLALYRQFILGLIMTFATAVVHAEDKSAHAWQSAPDLPYRVQEIYPTVYNDHIVVAGGLSPDVDENRIGVSDRVVAYSLKEQSWIEAPRLPEPRHHPMLVAIDNRLLAMGGFTIDAQGVWHNSVDVYELQANPEMPEKSILQHGHWQKVAQLPAPLAETLSAVHEGKVHLATGRTPINAEKNSQWIEQTDVNTHYIFDLQTLTWSQGAAVPTARNSACSVQANGNWHTIAGRTVAGGNLSSHEVYNFATKKWQTLAPLPQAQGGLACAAHKQHIYVFGGEYFDNGGGVYAEVWQYNIATDKWHAAGTMPKPRHGLGALSVAGDIYVIAGALQASGNQTSAIMSVFSPEKLQAQKH